MAKAILLAEDSPDDELLFKLVLEKNHIENSVVVVRNGAEVIACLEGTGQFADRGMCPRPEMLFLDLKMPGIDGFAVLEWLHEHPDVKRGLLVIVLTEFVDPKQIQRAYALGAHSFLPKPFSDEDLNNLMRHFYGRWLRSEGVEVKAS